MVLRFSKSITFQFYNDEIQSNFSRLLRTSLLSVKALYEPYNTSKKLQFTGCLNKRHPIQSGLYLEF